MKIVEYIKDVLVGMRMAVRPILISAGVIGGGGAATALLGVGIVPGLFAGWVILVIGILISAAADEGRWERAKLKTGSWHVGGSSND